MKPPSSFTLWLHKPFSFLFSKIPKRLMFSDLPGLTFIKLVRSRSLFRKLAHALLNLSNLFSVYINMLVLPSRNYLFTQHYEKGRLAKYFHLQCYFFIKRSKKPWLLWNVTSWHVRINTKREFHCIFQNSQDNIAQTHSYRPPVSY